MIAARDIIESLDESFLGTDILLKTAGTSSKPKKKKSKAVLKKVPPKKIDPQRERLQNPKIRSYDIHYSGRDYQDTKFSIIGNSLKDALWLWDNLRPWLKKNKITHKIATVRRVNIPPVDKYDYGQSKKLATVYIPMDMELDQLGKQLKRILKDYKGYKGVKGLPFWGYKKYAPGIYWRQDYDEFGNYIDPSDFMTESYAFQVARLLEGYKVCLCPRKAKVCSCPGGKEQVRKRGKRKWAEPYSVAQDYTIKGDYVMVEEDQDESLGTVSDLGALPTAAFDVIDGRKPRMKMFNIVYFARGEKGQTTVRAFHKEDAMKRASANLLRKLKGGFKILKVY
jgi:hypothetical protein